MQRTNHPEEGAMGVSLSQGHLQDEADSKGVQISAPAELTGLTGQHVVGKNDSFVSDK